MKRFFMFIVVVGFGALGLSIPAAQHLISSKTEDGGETIVTRADSASFLATPTSGRLKVESEPPSGKYMTESTSLDDREQVEVVARSITFPNVLYLGELMLTVEYPNGAILCLDAAYYAGQAQGLIWAMDKDTVVEHGLQWAIDDAKELFDACLGIFVQEAVADENRHDQHGLEDVRKVLSEQIQLIQEKLRYARDVKINADEDSVSVPFTSVPNERLEPDVSRRRSAMRVKLLD